MEALTCAAVVAHDATYRARGYRSFEYVSFEAGAGSLCVLYSLEHAPVRDLLLAAAGLVKPVEGSLVVCGYELAQGQSSGLLRDAFQAMRGCKKLPRCRVGLGVFDGVAPFPAQLSVEDAVSHEAALRQRRDLGSDDVLDWLARFGVATVSEQHVSSLTASARARVSAALALVGEPAVAVLDLCDPFVAGLSADDELELLHSLSDIVSDMNCVLLVATSEVRSAVAMGQAVALDVAASEMLAAETSDGNAGASMRQDAHDVQEATAR